MSGRASGAHSSLNSSTTLDFLFAQPGTLLPLIDTAECERIGGVRVNINERPHALLLFRPETPW